jgi:predicted kinase
MTTWLIYTCGYPFSGKSTLSRAIAAETGFALVEVDAHMTSMDHWLDAYVAAYAEVRMHLRASRSAVLDSVAHTRKNRARLHRIAAEFNATPLCVWLDVPVEEANRRRLHNQTNPTRAHVPDEGFEWITRDFEPPTETYSVVYSPDQSLDAWNATALLPALNQEALVR